jgi:hypothetical protein
MVLDCQNQNGVFARLAISRRSIFLMHDIGQGETRLEAGVFELWGFFSLKNALSAVMKIQKSCLSA